MQATMKAKMLGTRIRRSGNIIAGISLLAMFWNCSSGVPSSIAEGIQIYVLWGLFTVIGMVASGFGEAMSKDEESE